MRWAGTARALQLLSSRSPTSHALGAGWGSSMVPGNLALFKASGCLLDQYRAEGFVTDSPTKTQL